MRFAPLLILLLPILEIAGFIVVGDAIGVLPTIGLVVVTAVVGVMLVRREGLRLLREIQIDLDAGRVPADKLVAGAALALAGLLFLMPGFLTDIAAVLLILPPVRKALGAWIRRHAVVTTSTWRTAAGRPGRGPQPGVVDLDPDDFSRKADPSSPWRGDDRGSGGEPPALGPR